jgi:isoquinoline 1-oxidoreductase subunit beta
VNVIHSPTPPTKPRLNISHAIAIQSFAGELAAAAGKAQKDHILDLIGAARVVDVKKTTKDFWDYGENPDTYPTTPEACGTLSNWSQKSPDGAQTACGSWPRHRRPP